MSFQFPHADRSLPALCNHITQDVQLVCGDGGGVCQIWLHRNEHFTSVPAPVSFFFSLFSLSTALFYPVLVYEF
jgi:hypothetical protein